MLPIASLLGTVPSALSVQELLGKEPLVPIEGPSFTAVFMGFFLLLNQLMPNGIHH